MKLGILPVCSLALILMGAACGGGGGSHDVTPGDNDDSGDVDPNDGQPVPAPYTNLTFDTAIVEASTPGLPSGDLARLVRGSDGTLYYVYIDLLPVTTDACQNLAPFSGTTAAPGVRYDVKVAVQAAGATSFGTPERVPVEQVDPTTNFVGGRLGLDAAVDGSGNLFVATPGGGNGQFTCASANLLLGKRTPGGTYTVNKVTNSSADCCTPCPANAPQSACVTGTDSGYYPGLAFRQNGKYAITYLDAHEVTDNNGKADTDFEILDQGPTYSAIDEWSGYGVFSTLRFHGTTGLTASTNSLTQDILVWRSDNGAAWTDISFGSVGQIGGRVQIEVAPNGTIGLAYFLQRDTHDATANNLYYCESMDDGQTFPNCDVPESRVLVAGADPSLAYDSNSRPFLAYYYCGGGDCPHDGARMAWRDDNGKWWKFNVHSVDQDSSGLSTGIVVDPTTGVPTIVFRDTTTGAAMVAYGKLN